MEYSGSPSGSASSKDLFQALDVVARLRRNRNDGVPVALPRSAGSITGSSRCFLIRSILFRTGRIVFACVSFTRLSRNRRPLPGLSDTSTTTPTTSTSLMVLVAVSTMRTFMRWRGRWMPGVSTNTICPVGVVLDAQDPVARRLRLVGHDCQLVADNPVQQRRLAGVRPADEGYDS